MTTPSRTEPRSIQAEKTEPYDATDKRQWLAALPDDFLACRLLLHAWIPPVGYYDTQVNSRPVKEMRLVCDRCAAEKLPRIRITGRRNNLRVTRDSIALIYPEGYLAPSGLRVDKDELWAEWMRRQRNGSG